MPSDATPPEANRSVAAAESATGARSAMNSVPPSAVTRTTSPIRLRRMSIMCTEFSSSGPPPSSSAQNQSLSTRPNANRAHAHSGRPASPSVKLRMRLYIGANRFLSAIISVTPAVWQASIIRWQSATLGAMGFSHSTWSPCAAACSAIAAWSFGGVHRLTASSCAPSSIASNDV